MTIKKRHGGTIRVANTPSLDATSLSSCWKVGQRIVEEEQRGEQRAEYEKKLISEISDELTAEFGRGFSARNLMYYRKFYQYFPDQEILNALSVAFTRS